MNTSLTWIAGGVFGGVLLLGGAWFIFFSGNTPTQNTNEETPSFGTGDNQSGTSVPGTSSGTNIPSSGTPSINTQKIFQIHEGSVAGATLIQTDRPTTTVARYVLSENGRVFDLVIDSAGAVPRTVSNTTIPGVTKALWTRKGNGVVLQYLDKETVKTVHLAFPTTATSTAVRIQFLVDGIVDLAVSPDGNSLVYLLKTTSGVDGYTALVDGSSARKVFSLPLSEMLVSWPSPNTFLLYSKPAAGVFGVSFSVTVSSGAVSPLLYAQGFTATANRTFSTVVYQTTPTAGGASTYAYAVQAGTHTALSFDPYPEKCLWSAIATSTLYCAAPAAYVPSNYLDLWHQGRASAADTLFSFNVLLGRSTLLGTPGGTDGGEPSDIADFNLSPDEKYLVFVKKGSRSLWGVRLSQ